MKAFPQLAHWDIDERNGMNLRDYFAAKAMQSIIIYEEGGFNLVLVAEESYRMADEMMEARK
jgi:hypothetical protein